MRKLHDKLNEDISQKIMQQGSQENKIYPRFRRDLCTQQNQQLSPHSSVAEAIMEENHRLQHIKIQGSNIAKLAFKADEQTHCMQQSTCRCGMSAGEHPLAGLNPNPPLPADEVGGERWNRRHLTTKPGSGSSSHPGRWHCCGRWKPPTIKRTTYPYLE